ncbi:hypothetical protein SARC_17212 [Sphaeroforma arctica JP610]|uniref:Uncharacterized protein n=1 Tax=Sphaeroforma arctica JP610 TaxID=667725 RepID=A0A0L0F261_9EUKA|nr:hypothetical protein SARC_17212 [Sphaeroforma arctica JP610]KNC70263.1 hypothetical protein SARC_17212 [Sphaeroforma arctica JP610]|eukprot:XP_014144165.1 hypothetical protein SARC_17212 [Sphaeroforma arctica JP610]
MINRMKAAGVSTISTRLQGALTGSMTAAALHRSPDRTFTNPEGLSLGTPVRD